MTKYGIPIGYPGNVPASTDHDTRRSAPAAASRARVALRRGLDAFLRAQVRVAGGPWDGGRPAAPASRG